MSTSACGAGGPNGAVGGLDDTSVPGAGECGAGKAYCKRYRRLAANGDFTGLAFVGEDKERPMKTVLAYIERKGFSDKPVAQAVKLSSQGSCTGCHVKCKDFAKSARPKSPLGLPWPASPHEAAMPDARPRGKQGV